MIAPGSWYIHCHMDDHIQGLNMLTFFTVTGNLSDDTGVPLRELLPLASRGAAGNTDTRTVGADGAVRTTAQDILGWPVGATSAISTTAATTATSTTTTATTSATTTHHKRLLEARARARTLR